MCVDVRVQVRQSKVRFVIAIAIPEVELGHDDGHRKTGGVNRKVNVDAVRRLLCVRDAHS